LKFNGEVLKTKIVRNTSTEDLQKFQPDSQPFFNAATVPRWPTPTHYRGFTITLRHTTVGRTPLDE
jgi:hypothetical protein